MATVEPGHLQAQLANPQTIRQHLEVASQLVQAWPPWKQHLLELTSRSVNSSPRVVIEVKITDNAVANE
jgi:hypothetical protein